MNSEIQQIIFQLTDTYDGDPWFGKSAKKLLAEASDVKITEKTNEQHSILELLWHMITWREFTISRLEPVDGKDLNYFEENDWRELDHSDKSLWQKGLQMLDDTQLNLIYLLQQQNDNLLNEKVQGRTYNFRKLLYGIIQHDIYHLGQIAYIKKFDVKKL
jgi:uncharacterized damage-inducible protein DinB